MPAGAGVPFPAGAAQEGVMVFAIELAVTFNNAARRNAAVTAIQTRLDQLARWGITDIATLNSDQAPNVLHVFARFLSAADRDAFWAELDARLGTGGQGPIAGSWAAMHDCTHDEASPVACTPSQTRTW